MRRGLTWQAALLAAGLGWAGPFAAASQGYGGLPAGQGRATVYGVCSGCHSTQLIQQQAMNRKKWDETLTWMIQQQGMANLQPQLRRIILDYLVEHFGPNAQNREGQRPSTGIRRPTLNPLAPGDY